MFYPIKYMLMSCLVCLFNTAVCYLPSSQNMEAKGYSSILLPEIKKQVVIITLFCSEVKTLAN